MQSVRKLLGFVRAKNPNDKVSDSWLESNERASFVRQSVVATAVALFLFLGGCAYLVFRGISLGDTLNAAVTARGTGSPGVSVSVDVKEAEFQLDQAKREFLSADGAIEQQVLGAEVQADIERLAAVRIALSAAIAKDDALNAQIGATRAEIDKLPRDWLIYGSCSLIIGVALWLLLMYLRAERMRTYRNRILVEGLSPPADADEAFEFGDMWRSNREQLKIYHELVLNYATSTRQGTLLTLFGGFVFLVVVIVVALFARSVPSAIVSSVVSASAAGVTAFVARAVLRNADTSSREVISLFSHPLELERALYAERLVLSLGADGQDAAKLLLIKGLTTQRETKDSN